MPPVVVDTPTTIVCGFHIPRPRPASSDGSLVNAIAWQAHQCQAIMIMTAHKSIDGGTAKKKPRQKSSPWSSRLEVSLDVSVEELGRIFPAIVHPHTKAAELEALHPVTL